MRCHNNQYVAPRYLGLLLLQLATKDAPTLWQSTQADDILEDSDMRSLAYGRVD